MVVVAGFVVVVGGVVVVVVAGFVVVVGGVVVVVDVVVVEVVVVGGVVVVVVVVVVLVVVVVSGGLVVVVVGLVVVVVDGGVVVDGASVPVGGGCPELPVDESVPVGALVDVDVVPGTVVDGDSPLDAVFFGLPVGVVDGTVVVGAGSVKGGAFFVAPSNATSGVPGEIVVTGLARTMALACRAPAVLRVAVVPAVAVVPGITGASGVTPACATGWNVWTWGGKVCADVPNPPIFATATPRAAAPTPVAIETAMKIAVTAR